MGMVSTAQPCLPSPLALHPKNQAQEAAAVPRSVSLPGCWWLWAREAGRFFP